MTTPLVSIIIPHYQTPDLARLCLRSIRRYTTGVHYEVIVIDNASKDGASLDYLRQVEWIRLIERKGEIGKGGWAHKEAVNIGFDAARAPYLLTAHTDTVPVREDWLAWHVDYLERDPRVGAVGTYKLELKTPLQLWLKRVEALFQRTVREQSDDRPYIRSHCALYRRDALEKLGLRYDDPENGVAGRDIHYGLEAGSYETRLLDIAETLKRVVHLNHGTAIMLPEIGGRPRMVRKGMQRIHDFLARPAVQAVFNDERLDRNECAGATLDGFAAAPTAA